MKASGRFGKKSINYTRYFDMAVRYLMGGDNELNEIRCSFDNFEKSDANRFGFVL